MSAKTAHAANYGRLGGYTRIMRYVNAVSLSISIYTSFRFTHYTRFYTLHIGKTVETPREIGRDVVRWLP